MVATPSRHGAAAVQASAASRSVGSAGHVAANPHPSGLDEGCEGQGRGAEADGLVLWA